MWPSVSQQHADAVEGLLVEGPGKIQTEVVVHVRGDDATLEDGTPLPDSVVADLIPEAFTRVLIHDSDNNRSMPPIAAATRPVARNGW